MPLAFLVCVYEFALEADARHFPAEPAVHCWTLFAVLLTATQITNRSAIIPLVQKTTPLAGWDST